MKGRWFSKGRALRKRGGGRVKALEGSSNEIGRDPRIELRPWESLRSRREAMVRVGLPVKLETEQV